MKRIIATMLVAAVAAIPVTGQALAKKKKPVRQEVAGTIAIPQPYAADGTCIYRAQRTLTIAMGEQANGYVGYVFEVDPKTANKPFKLEASDGSGLDISFYSELGDPADPTSAPSNLPFETPGAGGEEGKVPPGFPYAFVCMTEGTNASFEYSAGKGVK
ncbi:MAG TPA: hypothetical protein VFS18_01895 [Actinomycetota bacterium]|nr:hypothetical protein [Actinomycetota bacterium]